MSLSLITFSFQLRFWGQVVIKQRYLLYVKLKHFPMWLFIGRALLRFLRRLYPRHVLSLVQSIVLANKFSSGIVPRYQKVSCRSLHSKKQLPPSTQDSISYCQSSWTLHTEKIHHSSFWYFKIINHSFSSITVKKFTTSTLIKVSLY